MRNLITKTFWTSAVLMATPFVAFAQPAQGYFYTLNGMVQQLRVILNLLVPVLMIAAVVAFFWGLVKYLFGAKSDENQKAARQLMIWGIIVIVIMGTLWGLVYLIASNLGIPNGTNVIQVPQI